MYLYLKHTFASPIIDANYGRKNTFSFFAGTESQFHEMNKLKLAILGLVERGRESSSNSWLYLVISYPCGVVMVFIVSARCS